MKSKKVTPMQESILAKTKKLFWTKGYDKTSIKDIARDCGCTPGNIYNHFRTKEEIAYHIFIKNLGELIEAIQPLENDNTSSPVEQLRFLIKEHMKHNMAPPQGGFLNFEQDMYNLTPSHRKEVIKIRDRYDMILRTVLRRGIDAGVFMEIDEKMADFAIASTVVRARLWYSPKGRLSIDEISEEIFNLFYNGIKRRK